MIEKVSSKISHAEIFGGICALFCLIGAFLPWGTVSTIFGSISVSGIDRDGMITFILSIFAFGTLYWGIMKQRKGASSVAIILLGLIIALIAIVDGSSLADLSSESEYVYLQVGIGLYLTGIGGVGLIIAGLWNFGKKDIAVKRQSSRRCPNCGRGIPFDAKLCPYCGKEFIDYLESGIDKPNEVQMDNRYNSNSVVGNNIEINRNKRNRLLVLVGLIIIVGILVGAGALTGVLNVFDSDYRDIYDEKRIEGFIESVILETDDVYDVYSVDARKTESTSNCDSYKVSGMYQRTDWIYGGLVWKEFSVDVLVFSDDIVTQNWDLDV